MIVASDGVWEFIESDEAIKIVQACNGDEVAAAKVCVCFRVCLSVSGVLWRRCCCRQGVSMCPFVHAFLCACVYICCSVCLCGVVCVCLLVLRIYLSLVKRGECYDSERV